MDYWVSFWRQVVPKAGVLLPGGTGLPWYRCRAHKRLRPFSVAGRKIIMKI